MKSGSNFQSQDVSMISDSYGVADDNREMDRTVSRDVSMTMMSQQTLQIPDDSSNHYMTNTSQ